jgi:hypothetical protein
MGFITRIDAAATATATNLLKLIRFWGNVWKKGMKAWTHNLFKTKNSITAGATAVAAVATVVAAVTSVL